MGVFVPCIAFFFFMHSFSVGMWVYLRHALLFFSLCIYLVWGCGCTSIIYFSCVGWQQGIWRSVHGFSERRVFQWRNTGVCRRIYMSDLFTYYYYTMRNIPPIYLLMGLRTDACCLHTAGTSVSGVSSFTIGQHWVQIQRRWYVWGKRFFHPIAQRIECVQPVCTVRMTELFSVYVNYRTKSKSFNTAIKSSTKYARCAEEENVFAVERTICVPNVTRTIS